VSFNELVVVIPTRNRSDLVRNALNSVLSQSDCEIQVLVSDNSTATDQRADLSRYCQEREDERVRYIVPPRPLPMAQHWDWALRQALSLYGSTHFSFLTDRMMFKPEALRPLLAIITDNPDKILTYMHDLVDDFLTPVIVRQYTWTGNLYDVRSTRLLELSAQSAMYDSCIPRMLNCIVPRGVLNAIRQRFGNVFAPIAADWYFAYRALDMVDSILFYDKAALVHYAQQRSNGQSANCGIANEAYASFVQDLGKIPVNFAAPFPEIITVWNAIISEYCHARETAQSPKFPELDLDNYRQALAVGIEEIRDPPRRECMRGLLVARGWKHQEVASISTPPSPSVAEVAHDFPCAQQAPQIEDFSVNGIEFQSLEDALQHALQSPRKRTAASSHEEIIQGVRVPLPLTRFRSPRTQKDGELR
jgi:hypothetical protein